MKACAARRVIGSPQPATMRFHDRTADAKSHTRAMTLGGKEGVEDLICLLRGQSHAGVADGYHKFLILDSLRSNSELALCIQAFHRIDAVDHEVHEHLLQLHTVSHDLGKICGQIGEN